jgi:8-oxo-dGTP pyrophosphatase MutT (NUDIX family)
MFMIPAERLPAGFAERLDSPPSDPAPARPAATAVLLRDSAAGPEVLLMKRLRSAGFVPGAYVFPGGRVDLADADPGLIERADGLSPDTLPEPMFWLAALRETFEEAGVLLARDGRGRELEDAVRDPRLGEWREVLLAGEATLLEMAESLGIRLALDEMVACAHWITPLVEPRRFDTHFFLARLPEGREVRPDPREMADAVWLAPAAALDRFQAGRLPMVFPTVATLESLAGYGSVADILADFRERPVAPVLPRLVRTAEGVGIVIDGSGNMEGL